MEGICQNRYYSAPILRTPFAASSRLVKPKLRTAAGKRLIARHSNATRIEDGPESIFQF